MKKIAGLFLFIIVNLLSAEQLENVQIPTDTKVDWMELKSGEWVRGEFKGVYSSKVEFDSEEFNLVKFDLDDVNKIITIGQSMINLNADMPNLQALNKLSILNNSENEIIGKLSFENSKFLVELEDGTQKILDTDVVASISAGEPKESNYWRASVFLGLDILSGNSEQITITGKASAQRRTSLTRFRADYLSTYTKVDSNTTTADNNRLTSSFDLYQTTHFYWRLLSLEYLRDPFRNIDSKYTVSAGAGYDILYTDKTDWSITMGPGYQETRYDTVVIGSDTSASTPLIFLDTRFSRELGSDVDFLLNYNMYYVNTKSGRYVHHAEASLETEFINDFTADFSVFWDRIELPTADENAILPGKDDFKTMLSIGYSY